MDIKELLKNLDKNLINEETANEIANAFEKAVSEKTKTHVSLAVEKALMEQDNDHAEKLKTILEKADEDHLRKAKLMIKAISESHAKKLNKIVNFYKKTVDEKAQNFSEKVIGDLDAFLDKFLDKKIPYAQINEAVQNTYARKQLDKIKDLIGLDPSLVNENVKTVVREGKTKVDDLSKKFNEVVEENAKLNRELNKYRSTLLLEGKTKGMPKSKKEFIVKILEDKDVNYIKENFNYVVEMFENSEQEESDTLGKEAKSKAISRDANPQQIIKENLQQNADTKEINGLVGEYLSELSRIG
jgi:DNA-binding phage protein